VVTLVLGGTAGGAGAVAQTGSGLPNLVLVAGTDSDFPGFGQGNRALSASPVLMVTGAPLDLDVRRTGGTVHVRQHGVDLPIRPRSVLEGLPAFLHWTLYAGDGTAVASATVDVCPEPGTLFAANAWGFNQAVNLDPANPATPTTFPYPQECGDPLTTRAHWGFPSGWGAQFHIQVPDSVPAGSYTLDATINADGGILETSRGDDHVRMPVDVIDLTAGGFAARQAPAPRSVPGNQATAQQSGTGADLPDLVPLPSENIAVRHQGTADVMRFNSTMANLGSGPLRVEGFRAGAPDGQMLAYQVLFHNGVEVARQRAGTLVLDEEEQEWHFDNLARYQLVDGTGTVVASSGKIGFCMADVHQLDATRPGFVVPDQTGFIGCQGPLSRSVRETLDPGWGDEYDQVTPEQELDVTGVPNGTYRIEILADPDRKLREATRDNNVSFRTVVLGGTLGARTVTVPPIDGVDTEAAWATVHRNF